MTNTDTMPTRYVPSIFDRMTVLFAVLFVLGAWVLFGCSRPPSRNFPPPPSHAYGPEPCVCPRCGGCVARAHVPCAIPNTCRALPVAQVRPCVWPNCFAGNSPTLAGHFLPCVMPNTCRAGRSA
jgi:hypothetical protein